MSGSFRNETCGWTSYPHLHSIYAPCVN